MAAQDMPPPGGFATIEVGRTFAKPLLRQGIWAAIIAGLTINGFFFLRKKKRIRNILETEKNEHHIAIWPFYAAEQERMFLKHLRELRDEERWLMKDHPGWKLGTLYGEPVYKTSPPNTLPPISPDYYSAFRPRREWDTHVIRADEQY